MNLEAMTGGRRAEVANNVDVVRQQMASAAERVGRTRDDITLVAVTKSWPATDVEILGELGITDVAENKAQELASKVVECHNATMRWRFVGQLQRNKVKQVVPLVGVIESVDRPELVSSIAGVIRQRGGTAMQCLVQVNLDVNPVAGRAGVAPEKALELADLLAGTEGVSLAGVMGVAPRGGDAQRAFETLREVSEEIAGQHRSATVISAGMSGDYVTAIEAGATHIRLGSALLGKRTGFVR